MYLKCVCMLIDEMVRRWAGTSNSGYQKENPQQIITQFMEYTYRPRLRTDPEPLFFTIETQTKRNRNGTATERKR